MAYSPTLQHTHTPHGSHRRTYEEKTETHENGENKKLAEFKITVQGKHQAGQEYTLSIPSVHMTRLLLVFECAKPSWNERDWFVFAVLHHARTHAASAFTTAARQPRASCVERKCIRTIRLSMDQPIENSLGLMSSVCLMNTEATVELMQEQQTWSQGRVCHCHAIHHYLQLCSVRGGGSGATGPSGCNDEENKLDWGIMERGLAGRQAAADRWLANIKLLDIAQDSG